MIGYMINLYRIYKSYVGITTVEIGLPSNALSPMLNTDLCKKTISIELMCVCAGWSITNVNVW